MFFRLTEKYKNANSYHFAWKTRIPNVKKYI